MVKYVVLLKRRPDLGRATFLKTWQEEHLPIIQKLPGLRRVELNATVEAAGYVPDYDGIGVLWFDSVEAALEAFQSPQGLAARQDTPRFADPDSAVRFFAHELGAW